MARGRAQERRPVPSDEGSGPEQKAASVGHIHQGHSQAEPSRAESSLHATHRNMSQYSNMVQNVVEGIGPSARFPRLRALHDRGSREGPENARSDFLRLDD